MSKIDIASKEPKSKGVVAQDHKLEEPLRTKMDGKLF